MKQHEFIYTHIAGQPITEELKQFLRDNDGKQLIVSIQVHDPGTSQAQRGYYFGYIVPRMQQAFRELGEDMTKRQTEKYLRTMSPICIEEKWNGERYVTRLRHISELDDSELNWHIERIKRDAAEMGIVIDD